MIKAILFDIDGVLIDSFAANHKFLNDLLVKAGYDGLPLDPYRKKFHMTMMDVIKSVTKSTSEKEIKRIWDMGNTREVPYPMSSISCQKNINSVW